MSTHDERLKAFRPMRFEATVDDCIVVQGEIPPDIHGGYFRSGPTWRRPTKQGHNGMFSMDGMVQGLTISEGRATFRNRWIRTPKFLAEERAGRALFEWPDGEFGDYRNWALGAVKRDEHTTGIPQGTNFVNVFPFGDDILAVGEYFAPIALDPATLETRGIVPWSSTLGPSMIPPACFGDGGFTAHPKWDARTGTLYGWSFRDVQPYVTLHWVNPDGSVRSRELWDAPYAAFAHDMWLTENHVVIPFQPFILGQDRIARGLSVFGWEPERPTVLAFIPRADIDGEIKWITADFETQYIMHTLSANEVNGQVILDGPIFERPPFQFDDEFGAGADYVPFWKLAVGVMGRWIVDLETGSVKSERTGDYAIEFPKIDERYYGRPYRWGFLLGGQDRGMKFDSLVRRDVHTGADVMYRISRDTPLAIAEPSFIPRSADAPEGDGYVLVPVSNHAANMGEYQLFDTDDIVDGPIARIQIPFAMGWTPHGHWKPGC